MNGYALYEEVKTMDEKTLKHFKALLDAVISLYEKDLSGEEFQDLSCHIYAQAISDGCAESVKDLYNKYIFCTLLQGYPLA